MDLVSFVLSLLEILKVADAHVIGDILTTLFPDLKWSSPHSRFVQATKILNELTALGKIKKYRGYCCSLDCHSDYQPHAKQLTQDLAKFLIAYPQSLIHREVDIPPGLRADALILIRKLSQEGGGTACAVVYECLLTEKMHPEAIDRKRNIWASWEGALPFLSQLFQVKVPCFSFVTSSNLKQFLEAL